MGNKNLKFMKRKMENCATAMGFESIVNGCGEIKMKTKNLISYESSNIGDRFKRRLHDGNDPRRPLGQ
jgi:hypothetical protein